MRFLTTYSGFIVAGKHFQFIFFGLLQQVIRITVLVSDTTAPTIQQGKGLLIITIIDVNEQAPVSYYFSLIEIILF
jgi:hypothetical protein